MDSFVDQGYHWVETTAPIDSDVRVFHRGLPARVEAAEAGRVHALAAHFDATADAHPDTAYAAIWRAAAGKVRELLK